jgi:ABC-type polysaccharide/polyol phosphate export permease
VQYIIPLFVQILFYASPVAYQTAAVPERWRGFFLLNPLAPLFEGLRWSLLSEGDVRLSAVLYLFFASFMVLGLGLLLFRRTEREFADLI